MKIRFERQLQTVVGKKDAELQTLSAARAELERQLHERSGALQAKDAESQAALTQSKAELEQSQAALTQLHTECEQARLDIVDLEAEGSALAASLAAMRNSISWRATRPLRQLKLMAARLGVRIRDLEY